MSEPVLLDEIIEGMEAQSDFCKSFLNKVTGEVVSITDEEFGYAETSEDLDSLPDWQQEMVETAREILETDHYIQLPDQFDIDEYEMMERFCLSLTDRKLRETMYRSIKERGAFKRFKNNIQRFDIADDWYDFRDNIMKVIAREWCEENGVDCVNNE
ncbi:MAG TPA: hypothetical protein ENH29_03880 [Bacteroidetes bacterium]|nr:hypothetical protein [Bacteroidota bacterium]